MSSPAEKQFNEQVANAPIVKEIIKDLDGLKAGQGKLEDRMQSLEKKVDDGFNKMSGALEALTNEIKSDKEKALLESNKELKDALAEIERKKEEKENREISNTDKLKNGSIIALVPTATYFIAEKLIAFFG